MRIEEQSPFAENIVRGFTVRMVTNETLFQVAINVCYIVGERTLDCFLITCGIKNVRIEIPVPQFFFEDGVQIVPLLVGHHGLLAIGLMSAIT